MATFPRVPPPVGRGIAGMYADNADGQSYNDCGPVYPTMAHAPAAGSGIVRALRTYCMCLCAGALHIVCAFMCGVPDPGPYREPLKYLYTLLAKSLQNLYTSRSLQNLYNSLVYAVIAPVAGIIEIRSE